jgi:hypothetical protein
VANSAGLLNDRKTPGDPLHIDARTWNALIEAARKVLGPGAGDLAGGELLSRLYPRTTVLARNDTGGDLANRAVLQLGSPVVDPGDSPLAFSGRPAFVGDAPSADYVRFVVGLEPAKSGAFLRAVLGGIAVANVEVEDTSHAFAHASENDSGKLVSGVAGQAEILWRETESTGEQTCVVLLKDGTSCCEECGGIPNAPLAYWLSWPTGVDGSITGTKGEAVRYIWLGCNNADSLTLDPSHPLYAASPLYCSQIQLNGGFNQLNGQVVLLGYIPDEYSEVTHEGYWHLWVQDNPLSGGDGTGATATAKWRSSPVANGSRFLPGSSHLWTAGGWPDLNRIYPEIDPEEETPTYAERVEVIADRDGGRGVFLRNITAGTGLSVAYPMPSGVMAGARFSESDFDDLVAANGGNQPHTIKIGLATSGNYITASMLGSDSVTTAKIVDGAVTQAKIANGAVGTSQLALNSIGAGNIIDGQVGTSELANGAVTAAKIADGAAFKSGDTLDGGTF